MFWTAVVYGAGASLGACVGLFVFALMVGALLSSTKTDNRKIAEESLEALRERNQLGLSMLGHMEMIAAAIERSR
jgi:hypothetical protein